MGDSATLKLLLQRVEADAFSMSLCTDEPAFDERAAIFAKNVVALLSALVAEPELLVERMPMGEGK